MVSTTSAAASTLLSGPMPSADHALMNSSNILSRNNALNFATLSTSAPFPTITLDLTQSHTSSDQFQRETRGQVINVISPNTLFPQVFGQSLHNQYSNYLGLHGSQGMQAAPNRMQNADAVSSATAAITANPNFTAALAAAIASIIDKTSTRNSSDNNAWKLHVRESSESLETADRVSAIYIYTQLDLQRHDDDEVDHFSELSTQRTHL